MDGIRTLAALAALSLCSGVGAQNLSNPGNSRAGVRETAADESHSHFGAAFNQGPRREALPNAGAGGVHFPITTAAKDAQAFFNQGLNLVYSFQWVEAERAFRQALKHDAECAMAYWGLAMTDTARGKAFIALAQEKKGTATDRERRYIDALALKYTDKPGNERTRENREALAELMRAYPDDLDAKTMYAWTLSKRPPDEMNRLLEEVLAVDPLHPGANHYRIHLWDEVPDPRRALDSADNYTIAAPNVGHAQHMPGHIYASAGLWTRAVDAMDRATRVERKFMAEYGFLPHESWNYAHNQDYLISNLGYVGRIAEGVRLARELLAVPRDPKGNTGRGYSPAGTGRFGLMRMRVRGERWDEMLAAAADPGSEELPDNRSWQLYSQALATLGKGDLEAARGHVSAFEESKPSGETFKCALLEVRGRLAVLEGRHEAGLGDLREAAKIEANKFVVNDPPRYPRPLYESLAWGLMRAEQWAEAEQVLGAALAKEPENGFALAQRAEVLAHLGRAEEAGKVLQELDRVWLHADADLPALQRLGAACAGYGLPRLQPVPYVADTKRESYGPNSWEPLVAPSFDLACEPGKTRGLAVRVSGSGPSEMALTESGKPAVRGGYAVLLFYLGGSCEHCVEQLRTFKAEAAKFAEAKAALWAITPEADGGPKEFRESPDYPTILADPGGRVAALYGARDEFEDLPLHATVLVDPEGRIRWRSVGSEPFMDWKFLLSEIERLERRRAEGDASRPSG